MANAQETKTHILKIAKEMFRTQAFDTVSIRSIAKRADLTHTTVFRHFPQGIPAICAEINYTYHMQCRVALRKPYNTYIPQNTDLLLYVLFLNRFEQRELQQTPGGMDFYINSWLVDNTYSAIYDENIFVARSLVPNCPEKEIRKAMAISNGAWSEMHRQKKYGHLQLTYKEIRDETDILRWRHIGIPVDVTKEKIDMAYDLLEQMPIQGVHILD